MKLNLLIHQTAKKIYRKQWHWKRRKCYSTKPRDISREKYYSKFQREHTSHNSRANNSKRSGNKISVVILGECDQTAKWLGNGKKNTI